MPEITPEIKNLRMVYQQACENMRFQDDLRWSRFKTISVIEGAFLLALYQFQLRPIESLVIALLGSLLALIVSLLEMKDGEDARCYYRRSVELEKEMGITSLSFNWFQRSIREEHLVISALVLVIVRFTLLAD